MRLFPHTLSLFNPPISSLDDIQRFWQSCFRRWTAIWSICYKKPILPLQSRVVWSWRRRYPWFSKRFGSPYLSGLHNGQNVTMFTIGEIPTIVLLLAHANDDIFEKEDSSSFWSPHTFFRHIWLFELENQTKPLLLMIWVKKWIINFPVQRISQVKEKGENFSNPILYVCLIWKEKKGLVIRMYSLFSSLFPH